MGKVNLGNVCCNLIQNILSVCKDLIKTISLLLCYTRANISLLEEKH
jgi:hypothetical protein